MSAVSVKVEDVSNVKKKLSFEIAADKVSEEIDKAYLEIGKTAKIKGFRPGKVPRGMLERYYAPQMEQEVLDRLIKESYFKALVDYRIPAVSGPEIVESGTLEKGAPFTYAAQVEVKPEVEAKDYRGLKLKKEKFVSDPQAVEGQIEEMRATRASLEVSKRKIVREGDFAVIDFEGFIEGSPFQGGKAQDYLLELGSGSLIPGFEEQVAGMKREQEKEIAVTFPENYGNKDLAGKPATFKVVLKEIKEKVQPNLDDEFAKEFGLESLDQLREKVRANYEQAEKKRIEEDLRQRLMTELLERNPVEVPEAMVQHQLDQLLENAKRRLQAQGLSLETLGMSEENFRRNYRDAAVRQVQGGLILEAIARQEQIQVEDSEIDDKLKEIAEQSQAPLDAVQKYFAAGEARNGLVSQLVEDKVIAFLLEQAAVKEVAKEKLAGEKPAAEKE